MNSATSVDSTIGRGIYLLDNAEALSLGLWLWRWDLANNRLSFNDGWETFLGYAPGSQKVELSLFNRLCHPDDQALVLKNVELLISGSLNEYRSEHRLRTAEGAWRWFEDHGRITACDENGRPVVIAGVRIDVSARKEVELRAAERKTHQHFFAASNTAALWTRDLGGNLVFNDPEVAASFGLPPVLAGDDARRRPVHPDDRDELASAWERAVRNNEPFECEHRMLMADGEYRWVLAKAFPVFGSDGQASKWLGATNIIHDRKLAELELQESAEHLQSVIDTVPDAVIIMGEDGRIHSFSAGATKVFGYSADEVVGRSLGVLMLKRHARAHSAMLKSYDRRSTSNVVGHRSLLEGRKKSGARFPAEVHVSETKLHGERVFAGHVRDLTEQRRSQNRLQQLQEDMALTGRANAMTTMGSAIAHEINQPLAAAANYLAALRRSWSGDDPASADMLNGASQQVDRAATILKHLRDFVLRGRSQERQPLDAATIEEACALALMGPHAHINLEKNIPADMGGVEVDRVQFQQVIFNLIRNATEALTGIEEPQIRLTVRKQRHGILCRIEDNGPGIPKRRRQQLFEPFRSSKPNGMGVGLAICQNLVESHGGTISVAESDLGGAAFEISLPANRAQSDREHQESGLGGSEQTRQ
jgi:two-component system, LuxR family, sensor kinase FixL